MDRALRVLSLVMTAPRPVFPGQLLLITRRCTQRQFLLRPDKETSQVFTYCLAHAAQKFGITVLLSTMVSNHHHTIVWDPSGLEVPFREHFHKLTAKALNARWGRWENLWSSVEPSVVVLRAEDLLEKLVYVATNPVKDHLVERVHHWPGTAFVRALLERQTITVKRPRFFFTKDGTMPEELDLTLELPAHLPGRDELLAALSRRIEEEEERLIAERQRKGRRVLGRRRVLRQWWSDRPAGREPRRVLNPRVANSDKWLRIAHLQSNKQWQADYRVAYKAMAAGQTYAFPHGTYWWRRFGNAVVMPPPIA